MILVSGKEQKVSPFFENWKGEKGSDSWLHHKVLRIVGSISGLIVLISNSHSDLISPINLVHFYHGEAGIQTTILFNSGKTPCDVKNET